MIRAYITNLGKYNEGELCGEWVDFPVSKDEMDRVLDRIGIGHCDEFGCPYEELFVTDYDTDIHELDIHELGKTLGEYGSLNELNFLAARLDEMDKYEQEKFCAVLSSGIDTFRNAADYINLTYDLDNYFYLNGIEDDAALGSYWVENGGYDLEKMGPLANYINYEAFGRDIRFGCTGNFASNGFIEQLSSSALQYDGEVPNEYRVT